MSEREPVKSDGVERASVSRRQFVATTATAGAGLVIVPRHVLGRGFQAPSDTVNIATVGIGGMGFSNTRALLSQNIVAVCDVDGALLDRALTRFQSALNPPPPTNPPAAQQDPPKRRHQTTAAQIAANEKRPRPNDMDDLRRFVEQQMPQAREVPGLPGHARQAERHRRGGRGDARSHARADCAGGDGPRQARLRAEAAVLVGRRSAAAREEGQRPQGRHADGEPGTFTRRGAARLRIHHVRRNW